MKEQEQGTESSQGTWAERTAGTKARRCGTCLHECISESWQLKFQTLIPGCQLEVLLKLRKANSPQWDTHV